MVMAFVQSTEIRIGTDDTRALQRMIDVDLGKDGASTMPPVVSMGLVPPIVVRATAEGLVDGVIEIPLTADEAHLPLAGISIVF